MKDCSCVICHKEYSVKGIFTHYYRSHGTDVEKQKYPSGHNGKYEQIADNILLDKEKKLAEYLLNPAVCKECNNTLPIVSRNHNFCNTSCSGKYFGRIRKENNWVHSDATKDSISDSNSKKTYKILRPAQCSKCNITFNFLCSRTHTLVNIKCENCRKSRRVLDSTKLQDYRLLCNFKFGIKDFPEEFDFSLITQYGWYKPTNRGNNLTGVSRDHMVSVRYGFDNSIDPKIISHPANCRIIKHSDNVSKGINNYITISQLLDKINNWDNKYSSVAQLVE